MGIVGFFVVFILVTGGLAIYQKSNRREKALREYEEIQRKNAETKRKNDLWQKRWNELMVIRKKAKDLENHQEYQKAIELYLHEIELGESYNNIQFNNYSHSISRVIILYGKTKQFKNLKDFLQLNMDKYPRAKEFNDWEKRLIKLNLKLNKK